MARRPTRRNLSSTVARSKSRYKDKNDEYLRSVARRITRIPKEILEAALKEALGTAVEGTYQDSGNAAWHWSVGTLASPGEAPRTEAKIRYGWDPVGFRGDEGANEEWVINDVLDAGFNRIEHLVYTERHVALTLYNPIDPEGGYGHNAELHKLKPEELARAALEKARIAASKAEDKARTFDKGGANETTYRAGKRIK